VERLKNNVKHICPYLCEIYHATYKVDSAKATGYKRGAVPWLCLSQQENIKEATAPVKKNEEEQEAGHTIHYGQEAQLIFSRQRSVTFLAS
jgi:hypothetical protein